MIILMQHIASNVSGVFSEIFLPPEFTSLPSTNITIFIRCPLQYTYKSFHIHLNINSFVIVFCAFRNGALQNYTHMQCEKTRPLVC